MNRYYGMIQGVLPMRLVEKLQDGRRPLGKLMKPLSNFPKVSLLIKINFHS